MQGHKSTDAIFILRQSQEKYFAKENLSFAFEYLEKAFEQLPNYIICCALNKPGVDE